jgi:hypothetical protein
MTPQLRWRHYGALALLALAIWLPRAAELDRLVTPDEVNWLSGTSNFYRALAHADFADTYQLEHPGVTTMWAGTAGFLWRYPAYAREAPGQIAWWAAEAGPVLRSLGHEPLELLTAGRVFMVLAITAVLAAAFVPAVSLFGFWPALVGFLLIAADPFHIAHSRLLHLDGLLSSLMLLSLLALLKYLLRGGRPANLVVSGVAAGLAWLTKSPTLFLVPFVGLLVLLELWSRRRQQPGNLDWVWAARSGSSRGISTGFGRCELSQPGVQWAS